MFGAVILTFVITTLSMLVIFLYETLKNEKRDKNRTLKENDSLRRQISDFTSNEQRRLERNAYNRGLYDGRATDTFYRQCLRKITTDPREQVDVMMNGEREDRR